MPLSNLLKSAAGTCPFCNQKAGIFRRTHSQCERTHAAGWNQMVHLAAQAAASRNFDERALRRSISSIARRSHWDEDTITQALEEGWRRGVRQAADDGTITREEETRLRNFRNRLALRSNTADRQAYTQLEQASRSRLLPQAKDAALTARDGDGKLDQLAKAMRAANMNREAQFPLLRDAFESAVDTTLNSRLLTQDEEDSLRRYIGHFGLAPDGLNRSGLHAAMVKSGILRGITEGRLPPKQKIDFNIPFNLMKSETLVWVMRDADYLETVTRRERQGTSDGMSFRVARGVYYRTGTFRSRTIEWNEIVHADTGLLGFTTKHIYFAGSKKKFRVRYDRIVAITPFSDAFEIMRDALTAKPQAFRTGDDWFACNIAANLAQM